MELPMKRTTAFSFFLRAAAAGMALAGLCGRTTFAALPAAQSAPLIVVPNLVGYWSMDGATGGVVSDLSGSGNNGTLSGAAAIDTTNKASVPAGNPASLSLTGAVGDRLVVGDSASLSITGALTLAAWIRPTIAPGGNQHGILEKFDGGGANGYSLRLSSNNDLGFTIYSATGGQGISTSGRPPTPTGTWTHVAGVFSPTGNPQMVEYRDGNVDALTSSSPGYVIEPVASPTNGSAPLHIGSDYGSNVLGGNIDEVRIYNRALNSAEIGILNTMVQPTAGTLLANGFGPNAVLSWGPASNAGSVNVTYTVLRGPSAGVYDTAFNGINALTYTDTPATSGTYYYTVVAVSVIPSAPQTAVQVTTTSTPPPPPPPPPAPRTSKVGKENDPCGCGSAAPPASWAGLLGAALLAAVLSMRPQRRT
jgi:MYXO-CTERM domain-containing protein